MTSVATLRWAALVATLALAAGCTPPPKPAEPPPADPGPAGEPPARTPEQLAARQRHWSRHIVVDQFGYRPQDEKVAVVRDPREGYDAQDRYAPGARYELRRASDGAVVLSGALRAWRDGAVQATSGDAGWWFDFSAVREPGRYYVMDVERGERSASFRIDRDVYRDVLKTAVRALYYQRSGFEKRPPYAEACWSDGAAYLRDDQDPNARDVTDRDNRAKWRDMRGGWFDAGDTNKYVNNARATMHQLLTAYTTTPEAFGDDFGIPESGNGLPDLIDELRWELDWMRRMQFPDGSVAMKVGGIRYGLANPPSSDALPRYYVPSCTGATISLASVFAHAALVLARFPTLSDEVRDLRERALAAWRQFQQAPLQTACDDGTVKGGKANMTEDLQRSAAVVTAIYLYALTGESSYHDLVRQQYRRLQPYHDNGWSRFSPDEGEALLFYATLPNADTVLARRILDDKRQDVRRHPELYGAGDGDLYRNPIADDTYGWGSNAVRARHGSSNLDVVDYGIDAGPPEPYRARAAAALHYLHGTNPLGIVYLSNMYDVGASHSANRIFHNWYVPGSRWEDARSSACGPVPGLLTGGPNVYAQRLGVPDTRRPPVGQPHQKSYFDWGGQDASWTITEPAIYYQASYIRLLAPFTR